MARSAALLLLFGTITACAPTPGTVVSEEGDLPENVAALAAPNQNLSTARLREEDGCYWYSHSGPVETTELPLRTIEGRPICARAPS